MNHKGKRTINIKKRIPEAVLSRLAAIEVLQKIESEYITIDKAIERSTFFDGLSRQDKGLANAIIYGVLRNKGILDWIISSFSSTKIEKIEPVVLDILRTGIFQMKFMDRIPASAAVNTSVELAKVKGLKPFIHKFINAVLRKSADAISKNLHQPCFSPDSDSGSGHNSSSAPASVHQDDASYFYYRHSLPEWLSSRWLARFGRNETVSLCNFMNSVPPLSLRTNTLRISREDLIEKLVPHAETVKAHEYSDRGINLTGFSGAVADNELFGSGLFQVQDEAAQLVSIILDPQPGEKILDACCGLGGKTGHIGQIMKNEGSIMASDSDAEKLKTLQTEMQRLGINNVICLAHDFLKPVDDSLKGFFDRVLVDAPCSGLGVIRRNPDAKWTRNAGNLSVYAERQLAILENASEAVKPGGRLVYSVCTFEPEENIMVVERFLKRHTDFVPDEDIPAIFKTCPFTAKGASGSDSGFSCSPSCNCSTMTGTVTILPHRAGMDGFFAACFKSQCHHDTGK